MASHWGRRALVAATSVACAWLLVACASMNEAPVVDHSVVKSAPRTGPSASETSRVAAAAASTTPAVETRNPTYTVKPGDNLRQIALDTGQSWRDLAHWNNIENPDHIEVGQVLRVTAPQGESSTTTTTTTTAVAAGTAPSTGFHPLPPVKPEGKASEARVAGGASAVAGPASITPGASVPLTNVAAPPAPARDNDDDLTWSWPAAGPVVAPFDDARTKGLAIAGKAGDPVYAAADGRVVYAGSGLRGYGNLIIIKHNANYLTAYAHNQTLLVKEEQIVKRGQKIAEMGSTDADRVELHFEIRKQGKPIDPARLLPPR